MLKRLTIMTFVLGLVFVFAGAAFAGDADVTERAIPRVTTDFGVERETAMGPLTSTAHRDEVPVPITSNLEFTKASIASPDTNACWDQDYTDYDAAWYYFSRYAGDPRLLAGRFDVPGQHTAELQGTWICLYAVVADPAEANTTVPMQLNVWTDIGGLPDAMVHTEIYDLEDNADGGWYYLEWTTTPVISGGNYHVQFQTAASGDYDDLIQVLVADNEGALLRGSYFHPDVGFWGSMVDIAGADYNVVMSSVLCVYFADCYTDDNGNTGSGGLYVSRMPSTDWAAYGAPLCNGRGQQFFAANDTLKTVHVFFNNRYDSSGEDDRGPQYYVGTLETNYCIVEIWPDAGDGTADVSGSPLATRTIGPGAAAMYPVTGEDRAVSAWEHHAVDFSADNLMLQGSYVVTQRMASNDDAEGSIWMGIWDYGIGGSWVYDAATDPMAWDSWDTGFWLTGFWGNSAGHYTEVDLCRDEFANCAGQALHVGEATHIYGLPINLAGKVKGQPVNRLEKIRFQAVDPSLFEEDGLDYIVNVVVWANDGGFPGAELWRGGDLLAGAFTVYPGWHEVVIPGGLQVVGDFFVGYENASTNPDAYFYFGVERGAPEINAGAKYYSTGSVAWRDLGDAVGDNANAMLEIEMCSIPVQEMTCLPGTTEWTTVNGDMARTGHSNDAIGEAWCDLTLADTFSNDRGTIRSGPVVSGEYVVQSFSTGTSAGYYILNLADLTVADSITTTDYSATMGGAVRCTPTIVGDVLIVVGGSGASVMAFDMTTIGGPIAQLWSIDPSVVYDGVMWNGHGDPSGVRYGNIVTWNDGTDDILYFTDDANKVHAAYMSDGTPYLGWPVDGFGARSGITLAGAPLRSGATDGTNLYFSLFTTGVVGDVVAVSPADGSIVWSLLAGDGLQAAGYWGADYTDASETFSAGVAVDGGEVFANSNAAGEFPVQGMFYRLNASTGAILSFDESLNQTTTHPIVDAGRVIMGSRYTWGTGGSSALGGGIVAFSRSTGTIAWVGTPGSNGGTFDQWTLYEMALTCEPDGQPDILIGFSSGNTQDRAHLSFYNAEDGNEIFNRRVWHGTGANVGGPGAVAVDGLGVTHVLFADAAGYLYNLEKDGIDRPRLEVLQPQLAIPVPFGSPTGIEMTFPAMYTNTGCADLMVSMTATDVSNGLPSGSPSITPVRPSVADFASDLANSMTDYRLEKLAVSVPDGDIAGIYDENVIPTDSRATNSAAMATPFYLIENGTYAGDVFVPAGGNIVTAPGDTAGITVVVDGPAVSRGPQNFYVEFSVHNDPDYFMNDNSFVPEVYLSLVGGCLQDTTYLAFGHGGANFHWIFNTSKVGDNDFVGGDPIGNMSVDGAFNGIFGGFVVYGVSDHRLALNSQGWRGGPPSDSWISSQGDPNWVDDDCKPAISTGVLLGEFSVDGVTYEALYGDMVFASYIDSVQNFDDGAGGWDWDLFGEAPFDNALTMGISADNRTFGALDADAIAGGAFAALNNVTIEITEFTERNGNPVPDWKIGEFCDNDVVVDATDDVSSFDTVYFDYASSSGWATTDGPLVGLQSVFTKLPFGCGQEAMINGFNMERAQSATWDGHQWDSTYFYMSMAPNTPYGHDASTADDGDGFYTYAAHDFTGGDTYTMAIARAYYTDVVDATIPDEYIAPMANLMNKMIGFGRGDVDNDDAITLADIIYLAEHVNNAGPGPVPFMHLGDVDGTPGMDNADVTFMVDYYFYGGGCPAGDWVL